MSIARVVELTGGLATGLCGVIVALVIFKHDFEVSRKLGNEVRPLQELCLSLILAGPNLLVAIGAYFHAVRRDSGPGRVMIFFGAAFVIGVFLLFATMSGYAAIAMAVLLFGSVLFTLITVGSSFAVRRKSR